MQLLLIMIQVVLILSRVIFEVFPSGTWDTVIYQSYFVNICDVNNDAILDMILIMQMNHTLVIRFWHGDGSFRSDILYSTGSSPSSVAVGGLNNNHHLGIVVASYDNDTVSILLEIGDGGFATEIRYSTGSKPRCIATSDLNNDNQLNLIITNYDNRSISVLL